MQSAHEAAYRRKAQKRIYNERARAARLAHDVPYYDTPPAHLIPVNWEWIAAEKHQASFNDDDLVERGAA